jgi:hypothetical protein
MDNYETLYHIYAKGECIYHSLSEEKFSEIWDMLHKMIELLDSNFSEEDLQYEKVSINKLITQNASY